MRFQKTASMEYFGLAMSQSSTDELVLIVDDDASVRRALGKLLERAGYEVAAFPDGESCLDALSRTLPDLICLDLDMPGLGGLETLKRIKARHQLLPVIILTADASVESVVSATKLGAYDYLTKPVDPSHLANRTKNAIEQYRTSLRLTQLEREVKGLGYPGIVGTSDVMRELFRQMDRLAGVDVSVLLQGESGTGKELVARALHEHSGRKKGPFIPLNCAAIPDTLQESELFGHEKGAFTGASERRIGKFEQAHGGGLFLDEVAELSLSLQAKLLRVLQDHSFTRLGGTHEVKSDFRLIAATHSDLPGAIKAGSFREDLFFRIAVVEVELPPLRERDGDVLLLAEEFLHVLSEKRGRQFSLALPARELLLSYSWPGNVRELWNVMQRATVMGSHEVIQPEDFPSRVREHTGEAQPVLRAATPVHTKPPGEQIDREAPNETSPDPIQRFNLDEIERHTIEAAMRHTRGNIVETVKLLGISKPTLYRKIKKYGLRA